MHLLILIYFYFTSNSKAPRAAYWWSGFSLLQSWNVTIMHGDIATSTRKWYILKPEFKPSFPSFSLLLVSLVHSSPAPSVCQRNVFFPSPLKTTSALSMCYSLASSIFGYLIEQTVTSWFCLANTEYIQLYIKWFYLCNHWKWLFTYSHVILITVNLTVKFALFIGLHREAC